MSLDTISETRTKIANLRMDLQVGKIFSSLGKSVGLIIDSATHNLPATEVKLPNDEDRVVELLKSINEELGSGNMDEIDDADINLLLTHLGSFKAQIRDSGIFTLFGDLLQYDVLSKKQKIMVFDQLISDEMLLSHINETENDAAYLRAYTLILLATFIYIDRAGTTFIDPERKNKLVDQIVLYTMLENDTRGYEDGRGWIHAFTHLGNVLDELASDEELIRADKILLMCAVVEKIRRLKTPLIYGESIRLAVYLADQLYEDDVYQQFLLIELREWRRSLEATQLRESSAMWNALFNRQRFLQAIVLNPNMANSIVEYLEDSNDFTI
jgi:hypothetical protein